MALLAVPDSGLTLVESPQARTQDGQLKPDSKPIQVMQLELTDAVLQEILKSARQGGKGVNLSLGKTITLHYGNKSQPLATSSFPSQSQLYEYSPHSQNQLALTGRISHKLAMQKAQEDIAGADEALAKLQSQLASHERDKQSKQIKYVPDSTNLPPPVKQTAATIKQHSAKSNSLSFLKKNNIPSLLNDTTRSVPTSPSIGATRIPPAQKHTPTSVPALSDRRVPKAQALKQVLIHLLAARPASKKLLVQQLKCKGEEVEEILNKVGKPYRLDQSKWDLTDKAFKELDVWDFSYPNQEDRELAIGRGISAFDRMRLSTQEKLWDMLIPKEERGKGKILSHLNLHKGPIQSSTTPKIQIQHPANDTGKDGHTLGNESDQKDRLAPSDAEPMARSRSHGPIKQTKVSEKEAQSKRLLSKGPKKTPSAPQEKEAHPAVKKGGAKKANPPKSSEFVNESDEEDGLEDAANLHNESLPTTKSDKPGGISKGRMSSQSNGSTTSAKAPKPAVPPESVVSARATKKINPKIATSNHTTAISKTKPTMVDDLNGKDGRDKESRLVGRTAILPLKAPERNATPLTSSSAPTSAPKHRLSDSSQGSTAMKKTLSRQRTTSSPHKPSPLGSSPPTNASDFDNPEQSSTASTPLVSQMARINATPGSISPRLAGHPQNTAEYTLKRKSGDRDAGIYNHGFPMSNGNLNGYVNGGVNSAKRHKASDMTPPTSDSDDVPLARDVALKKAQDFKKYYANYEKQYREISNLAIPPKDKVDELMRMHTRLAELKEQIRKGLIG